MVAATRAGDAALAVVPRPEALLGQAAGGGGLSDRLGPLREREFRLLFAGQLTSFTGSAMAPIALAFAVLDLTGSASDLGIVLAAAWVPQVVFILAGGVWSDRLPRHVVMVGANVLSGVAQCAAAALLLTGRAELWQLAALQALRGIATSFFFPAAQGVVPQTISPPLLQQANALLRLSLNGTNIAGSAVGGGVVAALGPGWAIAFDGATYLASAGVLTLMRVGRSAAAEKRHFLHELVEGWQEFRSREWLWVIVIVSAVGNMVWVGGQAVLGPLVAKESLGGAAAWGAIVACEAVGLVAGGLIALRWRPERLLLAGSVGLAGPPLLLTLLAAPAPAPAVAAGAFAAGVGLELFNLFWVTALQQHIPERLLSRVSSYDALGSFVFIPLGLLIAGPVGAAAGLSKALWGAAAVSLLSSVVALASRDVRRLRRLVDSDDAAGPAPA